MQSDPKWANNLVIFPSLSVTLFIIVDLFHTHWTCVYHDCGQRKSRPCEELIRLQDLLPCSKK